MSSPETTDSSLPNDQPSGDPAPNPVSADDFKKLQGNYHAAQRQIQKLKSEQVAPDNLITDQDFVRRVFEAHDVPFDDEGKFKLPEGYKDAQAFQNELKESISTSRAKWEKKDLNPLQERYATLESKYQSERKTNLIGRIDKAARDADIVDGKFEPVNPLDKKSLAAVHAAANSFREHPDTGDWVLFSGDDPVFNSTGDVITPESYWEYFKENAPANVQKDWFGNPAQHGSGFQNTGRMGGSFTMSRQEARDNVSKYRALEKAAKAKGQKVTLV